MSNISRTIEIKPSSGWGWPDLREIWDYRELLWVLTVRDLQVRYKQTLIGVAWVLLQPIVTMIVFTLIFGKLANMPSDGIPYPVFVMCALLPWQLFAKALTEGSGSMVTLQGMMTKVYFPRLFAPFSEILSAFADFLASMVVLAVIIVWFGVVPGPQALLLPFFVLLTLLTALAVSLWLSAINVLYRDVKFILPFLAQIWMFATPVAYPISVVPDDWRWLIQLNPMTGVVEAFRWSLAGGPAPSVSTIVMSTVVMLTLLLFGLRFFERMQRTFADRV